MKHLVYCILSETELPCDGLPVGVDGDTVSLLCEGGLAAVHSIVSEGRGSPDAVETLRNTRISRVKAYASVIDALHRTCTVLPMRYGCLLPTEAHISELLRERRDDFLSCLDEVRGCVEMVLYVPLEDLEVLSGEEQLHAGLRSTSQRDIRSPGIAHLAALKRHYMQVEASARAVAASTEQCRSAFEGLFVKWKSEFSPGAPPSCQTATLRLFFLVRREDQQDFVETHANLVLHGALRGLLSGPWPPHNFVPT